MIFYQKKLLLTVIALMATATINTACGNSNNEENNQSASSVSRNDTRSSGYIEKASITDNEGKTWVPLEPAIASLGYRMKDETSNGGYAKIGFSDVMYMLRPDSRQVFSLGEKFSIPEPPQRRNGHIYMTTASLSKLLQTEVGWNPENGEIAINTPSEPKGTTAANRAGTGMASQGNTIRIQSASVDTTQLISYAKRFLGVPYEFGAGPYEESKTFDCSSFTRHVFKKYGVNLPRLAKDQDNQGRRVSRSELAPGDLIFFTVPGRFRSDAIPGHVGIYMGNGKIIHTWGDPGVQISNLDTGYWSNVTLHMQRVL
ncbi:NlpC/P60 family protein [Paenibacillus sp. BR2-3]|uniref:C40 family peptidase n=1 Tax=Paenibacillus sp. BR2-3 TaxID=3048494 RepID=UPI00397790A8